MESSDQKMLKLFEILEKDCTQSQRKLSKKLQISLGLANSLIQKSIKKGYIKSTACENNKVSYSITQKGNVERTNLTINYIQNSLNFYNYIRLRVCKLIESLVERGAKNIIIYGTNELAEIASILLREYDLNLIAIIDNEKAGRKMIGKTIRKTSFLKTIQFDALIFTCMEIPKALVDDVKHCGVSMIKIHGIRSAFDKKFIIDA